MKLPHKTQLVLAIILAAAGLAAGLVYQEQRIKVDLNIGEAQSTILYQTDFPCYPAGVTAADDAFGTKTYWQNEKIVDRAGNVKDTRDHTGNGTCSARTGGGSNGFGKLIIGLSAPQEELWMKAWVFLKSPWNDNPNSNFHIWRFTKGTGDSTFQFDFTRPQPTLQVFFPYSGGSIFKNISYNPVSRAGQWQCWETYVRLNTPGQSNGFSELYVDGALIDSLAGNFRGSDAAGYGAVNLQSNWSSNTNDNFWLIDDVVISTSRVGCGSTPPPSSSDTTAPSVSISSPSAGASVSGTITVSASASDPSTSSGQVSGVAGVQFLLNGSPLGSEDTTSPYSVSWNTTTVANGTYTLSARARDAAGNQTTSGGVSVTVNNQTSSSCFNPSPLPSGFAAPCPVLSLSASTVSKTGSLTVTATPPSSLASYQYKTIYLSDPNWACSGKAGGFWCPLTLGGTADSQAPAYIAKNTGGSLTLGSSVLPNLASGVHYLLSWDWAWDQNSNCYKGPGLNTCNTGAWRVQTLNVQ